MKTYSICLTILISLFLVAGCLRSPEKSYAQKMDKIIPALNEWELSISAYGNELSKPSKVDTFETYDEMLAVCIIWTLNGDPCSNYYSIEDASPIIDAATDVMNKGYLVKSQLGALMPPSSIKVAHEQVLACVDQTNAAMGAVIDLFQKGSLMNSTTQDDCKLLDMARSQILDFIAANR